MKSRYIRLITEKVYAKSGLGKWFNKESAGGGPGWDRYNTKGERVGKCGDAEEGDSYAACLSKQKADKLGKEGVASFVRRKRAAQHKAGRGEKGDVKGKGKKPVYVKTGVTEVKEAFDFFIVEDSNNLIPLTYNSIEVKDLLPFDLVINEAGDFLNVDMLELNEDGTYTIIFTREGEQLVETFSPDTVVGFVDVTEGIERTDCGEDLELYESETKKVKLNKIMRGDVKKYKVYVRNDKGNVVKVNFGDPNMEIKRDDPDRRRNFRARHNCDNPGPRWKARYWACKTWSAKPVSAMLAEENKPKDSKKWSSCIAQAKKKFDVYPSAYANAWASKCYKSKGGKWKKLSEDIAVNAMQNFANKNYNSDLFGLIKYRNSKN
jgi:hypothetical protein